MRRYKRIGIVLYVLSDLLMAMLAWTLFFVFRKTVVEGNALDIELLQQSRYFIGVVIIPICWLFVYFLAGTYTDIYRKSRLGEFTKTIITCLIGVLIIFFLLLLDDQVSNYKGYYILLIALFILHFSLTFLGRLILLTFAKKQLKSGKIGYRTLIVGGNKKATELYENIIQKNYNLGYKFIGFIDNKEQENSPLEEHLTRLGDMSRIEDILNKNQIDELVIAIDSSDHVQLREMLNKIASEKVVIKIIPDLYDILAGSVKMGNVLDEGWIEIHPNLMPEWQKKIKRLIDVVVSGVVLLLLSPVYLFVAIQVKLGSKGPIFYLQERLGKGRKPFNIIKFRSMRVDAEKFGPALSSKDDGRMTSFGKVMRKWRLDEIPQFWNVFRGDMSLVGPRPERDFFYQKIIQTAPEYRYLYKVKPGITSWGMVKFGYAENVEEMIQRMKYDLLYIENMSLAIDFKIMIYTALVILQGKGK